MLLSDVLTSTNMNPLYYKYIPFFIKAWKKHFPNINIHIIVISNKLSEELQPYKHYIKLFPELQNINTAFIAQTIRILYPAILKNATGGIIITDMDMLPMGKKYYIDQIKDIDSSKFVCYRPLDCVGKDEMVICYNIAHYNIWSDIFNIKNEEDIKNILYNIYSNNNYSGQHGGIGWSIDQLYLYKKTQEWNTRTKSLCILQKNIHVIMHNLLQKQNNYYVRLWKYIDPEIIKYFLSYDNIVDYHIPKNCDHEIIKKIINIT